MRDLTFNEQDMTVSYQDHVFGLQTIPWVDEYIRQFVVEHMSSHGKWADQVQNWLFLRTYLAGNGFGVIDREMARQQCYDWSHVRDSDTEGFYMMGLELVSNLYPDRGDIREYATSALAQAMQEGIDPISALPQYDRRDV